MPTFRERLREGDRFFAGTGKVHRTTKRITIRLAHEAIPYAIIGGMAMNAHGFQRVTTNVDLLITREGLDQIHAKVIGSDFEADVPGGKRLRDTKTGVTVQLIVTGDHPDDVSTDIAGKNVIRLDKLIELKLAAANNSLRIRDLADVQDLIKALSLPRALGEQIDESVRDEYYRRWQLYQTSKSSK